MMECGNEIQIMINAEQFIVWLLGILDDMVEKYK